MSKLAQSTREDLLSLEKGVLSLNPEGKIRAVIIYPNVYRVAMSNLGFQSVYGILNEIYNISCERAFLPEADEEARLLRTNSRLCSFESSTPLPEFDLIIFSVSFENDYLNVLKILSLSGIPLLSSERDDNAPLIIAGGIALSSNPEPLSMFIDLFLLGEAEPIISSAKEKLNGASGGEKKGAILAALSEIEGAYLPQLSARNDNREVKISRLTDMEISSTYSRIVTPESEFSSMHIVEVSRGCPAMCRFCLLGNFGGKLRFKSAEKLLSHIDKGLNSTSKVGLITSSMAEHREFSAIASEILKRKIEVSFSSIRFADLKDEFVNFLIKCGQKTVTLAPECGTDRMRQIAGKELDEDEMIEKICMLGKRGIKNIKLYFLVGLPGETEEDVGAIVSLVKKIRHNGAKHSISLNLSVSASSFVPKPFTPFQWAPMDDIKSLKEKLGFLTRSFGKLDGVGFSCDLPKFARIQGMLSRADRRAGSLLIDVLKLGGDWNRALRESEVNPDYYVMRERDENEKFPWDFISAGVSRSSLYMKYKSVKKDFSATSDIR